MVPFWIKMHRRSWKKKSVKERHSKLIRSVPSASMCEWCYNKLQEAQLRQLWRANSFVVFADLLLVFCLVAILCCRLLRQYTRKAILADFYMLRTNDPLWFPLHVTIQWAPLNLISIALSFVRFMKHIEYRQSTGLKLKCFWQGLFCNTARKLMQNFPFIEIFSIQARNLSQVSLADVRIMSAVLLSYYKGAEKAA